MGVFHDGPGTVIETVKLVEDDHGLLDCRLAALIAPTLPKSIKDSGVVHVSRTLFICFHELL